MDLDVITTVLAVAKTKSFSSAAFMIPCAQSSVSRRVESAETELKAKLFSRPSDSFDRSVRLTPVGEKIIPIMETIVNCYRQMFATADTDGSQSVIRLGVKRNIMPPLAFSMMKADFFETHPTVSIDLQFSNMDALLNNLKNRMLDAVMFSCVSLDPSVMPISKDYNLVHLGDVALSIGISNQNPLAKRESVTLAELQNEIFLLNDAANGDVAGIQFTDMNQFQTSVAQNYKFHMKTMKINDTMLEIRYRLAQQNKGVFPCHTPHGWRSMPDISYVRVSDCPYHLSYYLLYRKSTKNDALDAFSSFLSSRIKDSSVRE